MLTQEEAGKKMSVCDYLDELCIRYMLIDHLANHTLDEITALLNIPKHTLLRTVLVQDDEDVVMFILPKDYFFDIGTVAHMMNKRLRALTKKQESTFLTQLNRQACPPLPEFVGMKAYAEKDLLILNEIYFTPSNNNALIGMKREDYMAFLHASKLIPLGFPQEELAIKNTSEGGVSQSIQQLTPLRIKQRLKETIELPAIPLIAQKILKLRFNPQSTSKELAQAIDKDPSLSAQLMSWAKSPYYGYQGKITSIEDAIVKVLGFDLVMNLALGIILGRTMRVSVSGPLGLKAYWQFAILCGALVERIAKLVPHTKRPMIGLAYLGGLLHNFGHLLLAQVFPPHFSLLTEYVVANPQVSIKNSENYVLGMGHDEIGAWLSAAWELPAQVCAAIRYHHDENYKGEYAIYPNMVLLATRLLKRLDIGDADSTLLPQPLLLSLGLTESALYAALDYVMSQREDLFELAEQVVPK